MKDTKRIQIRGTGIPVRGNDIDTDRIIPARFLRTVVFDGLGEHAFEDDRSELAQAGEQHTFDNPSYRGASVLIVNKNFGCGSSREHAPQAIMRWGNGIQAIIGESFAEIFYGNCASLGVPCAVASQDTVEVLQAAVEENPNVEIILDVQKRTLAVGDVEHSFQMPDGLRNSFLDGRWDSTTELIQNPDQIRKTAAALPYVNGF